MARAVKMSSTLLRRVALALACGLPVHGAAVGPNDPFTPPARTAGVAAVATFADALATAAAAPATGLAGVRLGSAPAALIDGEWVAVGHAVRGAQLSAVRLDGALLRHPDGRTEHLALYPSAPATASASTSPPAPGEAASASIRIAQKRGLP